MALQKAGLKEAVYTPGANAEHDISRLHQFIRENPLCALVTRTAEGLCASHIPMVLHEKESEFGVLRGHVARANSQWRDALDSEEALGIFSGPQHYISASWYPDKATHGREVPTWNYVAVHVYGPMRTIEDGDWLLEHLRDLTDRNEVIVQNPWHVSDAPADFIDKLSKAIVGVEVPITRIEGKWKISQNRSERDAAGVVEGLEVLGTPESIAMSKLIRTTRIGR